MNKINEEQFLKEAEQKAWEKYLSLIAGSDTPWDYVIITASNASQGEGFQAQIRERLDAGFLPSVTHYGVVPDPEGERVGNGGAVLGALRYVYQNEKRFEGVKVLIILSSGDSRRVAQYSAMGKVFSPVPRLLPNGRASTLFDEDMISLSTIPSNIKEGVLVISGDVMLAFDAEMFVPGHADAAAIAFPEPAERGAGHGVFLNNEQGNIAKVWHKQKPEFLKQFGAVDDEGNVNIDTGAVFFSPRVAEAIYSLVCENGVCTEESFHEVVNGYLAPSLYVDFFYPLAEDSTYEEYLKEIPEGKMSDELLRLRCRIWQALRPFRIKLCRIAPSRFIHFGTTSEVETLMQHGIEEYQYLGWKRQVASCVPDPKVATYNSVGFGVFGDRVYLEDSIVNGSVGSGSILSGVEIDGQTIPENVVLHTLQQTDGNYVTRIYGVTDNPKSDSVFLFGEEMNFGDVWDGEEKHLWEAKIYPVCATRSESIAAAINVYELVHGRGNRKAWEEAPKESLFSSFGKADGIAIKKWQQYVKEKVSEYQERDKSNGRMEE